VKPFLTDKTCPERIRTPAPPAVFGLPVRTLSIASRWCSPATGALLAGEIGRKPANLHLHIQRISLWHGLGDDAATAAAVIDLWIVLGALGQELRTRMLRQHYAALDKLDLGLYLSEHLQQASIATTRSSPCPAPSSAGRLPAPGSSCGTSPCRRRRRPDPSPPSAPCLHLARAPESVLSCADLRQLIFS
jgi:hypothetical protein